MKIVSLLNQKGGVGKTTVALNLLVAFHQHYKTLLFDLDPQASATEWKDARKEIDPEVYSLHASRLSKALTQAKDEGFDIVFIDTAPHTESTALEVARLSDLILIPCSPKIMDLRAMRKTKQMIDLVQNDSFVIINNSPHQGVAAKDAENAILTDIGLSVAPVKLGYRVFYDRSLIDGKTPLEADPDSKAAKEIKELYNWASSKLSMYKSKDRK